MTVLLSIDDIMMILTVVVALTLFVFTWCIVVLAVKGWAITRMSYLSASFEHQQQDSLADNTATP